MEKLENVHHFTPLDSCVVISVLLGNGMDTCEEEDVSSGEESWLSRTCRCWCCYGRRQSVSESTVQFTLLPLPLSDGESTSRATTPTLVSMAPFVLSATYNAENEYIQHFGRDSDDAMTTSMSVRPSRTAQSDQLIQETKEQLEYAVTHREKTRITPREIARKFQLYQTAIHLEGDPEKRRQLIHDYEQFKSALDRDNLDDQRNAQFYTENARNEKNEPAKRLEYYRKAVQYTNNVDAKSELRNEYYLYCTSLQNK